MKVPYHYFLLILVSVPFQTFAQSVENFTLPNVDGKSVSLSDHSGKKAIVVIFSSNHCVYSKKYEDRIISMANQFKGQSVSFILINSNDAAISEEESFEVMKQRAQSKKYPFPYLQDKTQSVAKQFNAKKNPQAFLLSPSEGAFSLIYSGSIDDNALMPDKVENHYLKSAIEGILKGQKPGEAQTDPIGCSIKWKD